MVETTRLKILPLSYNQLTIYLESAGILEMQLGLQETHRDVAASVKDRIRKTVLPFIKRSNADQALFFTFWLVIDRFLNIIVAELGFKGPPDAAGEIEIGYGTMPEYQGRGYMTEAVGAMIAWARKRSDIKAILAEINEHNAASIRVAEKNGFMIFERKKNMLWWRRQTT